METEDRVNALFVEDWMLLETDDIAQAIVEASRKGNIPVALVFEKPGDFDEYTRPDIFSPVVIGGDTYLRMPSSYTDASFLEGRLADMGYKPASISYGRMPGEKDFVLFKFVPEMPEKK